MSGNYVHLGRVRRLMKKTILNFHFDYWNPSLIVQSYLTSLLSPVPVLLKAHKLWVVVAHSNLRIFSESFYSSPINYDDKIFADNQKEPKGH